MSRALAQVIDSRHQANDGIGMAKHVVLAIQYEFPELKRKLGNP